MDAPQREIHPYERTIMRALICQAVFGILVGLNLDMGEAKSAYIYCSIPFWIGVAIIIMRRKSNPTKGDQVYIAYGLIPIMIFGIPLFFYAWENNGFF